MKSRFLSLLLLLIFALPSVALAQDEAASLSADAIAGEAIFKANCSACHRMDRRMTGPALSGALDRWEGDKAEMKKFIANSTAYIEGSFPKSPYAKKLYEEYNQTVMTSMEHLNDEQLNQVVAYIQEWVAPAPEEPAAAAAGGAAATGGGLPVADSTLFYGLAILVGALLFISIILLLVIAVVLQAIKAKETGDSVTWKAIRVSATNIGKNKYVVTIIVLVILGGVSDGIVTLGRSVGLHQGYQPTQPIAYNHATHAGKYEIDCKYCHVGVEHGKSATIPSTNICMNCHNDMGIKEGSEYGEEMLSKVREAHKNGTPIEWVRIHNLPDLVYFNHAQHVAVAGLECQQCHGPIEEMEEVYQFSELSMGWCINCHRETEVDINKNDYYRSIHQNLREQQENGELDKITVETLGGLECARCHY